MVWRSPRSALLDTNLLTNAPAYPIWNPDNSQGWHGPYLNKNSPDPWEIIM